MKDDKISFDHIFSEIIVLLLQIEYPCYLVYGFENDKKTGLFKSLVVSLYEGNIDKHNIKRSFPVAKFSMSRSGRVTGYRRFITKLRTVHGIKEIKGELKKKNEVAGLMSPFQLLKTAEILSKPNISKRKI